MNPGRVCGMCAIIAGEPLNTGLKRTLEENNLAAMTAMVADRTALLEYGPYDGKFATNYNEASDGLVDALREVSDCPACILSALRQGTNNSIDSYTFGGDFSFKAECAEIMAEARDHRHEHDDYGDYY